MATSSEAMILFSLCFSLVASSFCCAWIINDYSGTTLCGQGQPCGPIILNYQQIPAGTTMTGQDFTNTSGYEPNVTWAAGGGVFFGEYGEWEQQDGIGYVLTASHGWFQDTPMLIVDDIIKTNGVTTVNYFVDNPTNGDFIITPRYLGAGHTVSDIRLTFSSDGIHVAKYPDYFIFPSDLTFVNAPNVQVTGGTTLGGYEGSLYTTVLDENSNNLKVYKDGVMVFDENNMPAWDTTQGMSQTGVYYGGIGSNEVGFTLIGLPDTGIQYIQPEEETAFAWGNYWKGLVGWVDKVVPGAGATIQMIGVLGAIIVWTLPETVFPLWLNVLLIKTQVVAILYLAARLARGGG